MSGTDFKKNPQGPSTGGGGKNPDLTRMAPPPREKWPMPDPAIPVPEGGRTPFKAPVYAQPGLGAPSSGLPYKDLK